jgi:HNH endonuclease
MATCIYCQEERPKESFTKAEHVLPQSFGKFRQNMTLRNVVCDRCNQYFGDHLETYLGRDTFEGQLRFKHGVKNADEFKSVGPESRMVLKSTEGDFAGCYMYREYSQEGGGIVVKPLPQVGFMLAPGNTYEYFLLDKIPSKAELDSKGFQAKHARSIVSLAVDPDELAARLREKDIPFRLGGPLEPSQRPDTVLCELEGTIDHIVLRAISKIAFNYLARWEGSDFVQHRAFDKARRYIRWGHAPGYKLIQLDEKAVLADEPIEGTRRLGHLVTVNWAHDGISVLAQVSLFNWITYLVLLAPDFTGPPPELTRGHFFDVSNSAILELGARPLASQCP